MSGLGTDHVISGPMRGLKNLHPMAHTNRQTSGHCNSMTESAQWGRISENWVKYKLWGDYHEDVIHRTTLCSLLSFLVLGIEKNIYLLTL